MKTQTIVSIVLGIFVLACIAGIVIKNTSQAATPTQTATPAQAAVNIADDAEVPARHIIAYYFHNNVRCPSCHKIENWSREAITTTFAEEIEDGLLEFKMVNLDEEGNGHFVDDYELYTKHLLLVEQKKGEEVRYADLIQVWDLLGDQEKFTTFVVDNTRLYVEGKPCPEDHEDESGVNRAKLQ